MSIISNGLKRFYNYTSENIESRIGTSIVVTLLALGAVSLAAYLETHDRYFKNFHTYINDHAWGGAIAGALAGLVGIYILLPKGAKKPSEDNDENTLALTGDDIWDYERGFIHNIVVNKIPQYYEGLTNTRWKRVVIGLIVGIGLLLASLYWGCSIHNKEEFLKAFEAKDLKLMMTLGALSGTTFGYILFGNRKLFKTEGEVTFNEKVIGGLRKK